jgi:(Z)-2-((N-methylformamido)methylene)-5-hydroxybutyrolactone dehydrogenase
MKMGSENNGRGSMPSLPRYQNYINGEWVDARSGKTFISENPATREGWAEIADGDTRDIDLAVSAAKRAFEGEWSTFIPQERARLMRRLADLCLERGPAIAALEVKDNGKLITEQGLQWILISELLHHWAGMADKIHGEVITAPIPKRGLPLPDCFVYTRREPIGVVGGITPWNSPANQLAYKFGPAIAAGCTLVMKPSEFTPVSSLEFARLVDEAGFPRGVFNVVASSKRETGAALVSHPDVAKISFTGSTATGKAIVKSAAESMKRVTCELGGKSASIVFADADPEKAIKGVAAGIFAATGQTCMASSRVYVERSFHDEFVAGLTAYAEAMKIGDPLDPASQMGPIANKANYDKVLKYFEIARSEGVRIATGGTPVEGLPGYYVRPTVLVGVEQNMRVAREEIFGPVVCVMPFDTEDEAISLANDSVYGLAGAVFTRDMPRAHRVVSKVRAGTLWINTYRLVTHMAPFGGYKESGWGREGGTAGLDAFLETKAVWVPTV